MSHNGKLLTQIMNNLNKPKRVRTPKNQWQTPGQVTDINSQYITMQGVGFDAIGVSPDGTRQYMQDGQDYYFPTKPVREFPMMQDGGGWFSSIAADLRDLFGMEQPRKKGVVLTMPQEMEIKDPRKISRTTGKPINPNVELLSGKYPSQRIYNIVKAAKRYGVDPYDALAIDLQETGWGRISDGMVGHSMLGESQLIPSKLDDGDVDDFDMYARAIATKMQYADKLGYKDPEMRFQTYNGLGKVYPETEQDYHGFRMKKIYGVPVPKEGIDMRKNPLYGKRVMDIRDNILRKNPQLDMYVRHIKQKGGPIYVDNPRDPRLKAYQDSLSLYKKSLNNMSSEGSSPDYKNLGFVRFVDAPTELNDPDAFEKNDQSYPFTGSSRSNKKSVIFSENIKPIGFDVRYIPRINSKQYSSVYKKPEQPVQYRKPAEAPTLYVDDLKNPRLTAYNDSLRLYNTQAAYLKQFRKSYTPAQKKAFYKAQEANYNIGSSNRIQPESSKLSVDLIAPDGNPDYVYGYKKPVQPVVYRKPQPLAPTVQRAAPQPVPIPAPVRQYSGSPVYSPGAGSGMPSALVGFRSQAGDTTFIQPEDYQRYAVPAYGKQYIESQSKQFGDGGQHGGLDRWFAEKWVDVKTGKACGRQEGEKRRSYPACRPSRRVSSETPKTSSEMSPAEKAKFTRSKTSSERIPYNHQRRQFGGMSTTDSVRHQANKILQYEQLRGGPGGAPLPGYSDPKYMSMLMDNIYPEVKKILPNASAMEAAEAMDFIFNAGWDKSANKITKDPRAYALQEYYRQRVPSKLDADGKWSGRKNPAYSFDEEYNTTIGRLPENERRVLMNRARDWYYKNINNPSPGVPSSDYYDTWYGRIWNTNDFQPFNPNNPNFKPKKK